VDEIYKQVFGEGIAIERTEHEDDHTLDRLFAIDAKIIMPNQQILLGQEKFLSSNYANFRTVTVEYYQNPSIGECGDWFKLATQFYFTGYCKEDYSGFDPWVLVNWPAIVLLTNQGCIRWQENSNKHDWARASFIFTSMDKLPHECIIASSFSGKKII